MEPIERRLLSTAREVWCFSRREADEALVADPSARPRIRLLDPLARPPRDPEYGDGRLYLMRASDSDPADRMSCPGPSRYHAASAALGGSGAGPSGSGLATIGEVAEATAALGGSADYGDIDPGGWRRVDGLFGRMPDRIEVWRAIGLSEGEELDEGNFGLSWAWERGAAQAYGRPSWADTIAVAHGRIAKDDVDWPTTFALNILLPDEKEIRLAPGADIELLDIRAFDEYGNPMTGQNMDGRKVRHVKATVTACRHGSFLTEETCAACVAEAAERAEHAPFAAEPIHAGLDAVDLEAERLGRGMGPSRSFVRPPAVHRRKRAPGGD